MGMLWGEELERERAPVDVVFIAYGCGFGFRSGFDGDCGREKVLGFESESGGRLDGDSTIVVPSFTSHKVTSLNKCSGTNSSD